MRVGGFSVFSKRARKAGFAIAEGESAAKQRRKGMRRDIIGRKIPEFKGAIQVTFGKR
jgi:hypothetical protein